MSIKVDNERNLRDFDIDIDDARRVDIIYDGYGACSVVLVHAGDAPAFGTFLDVAALGHDE